MNDSPRGDARTGASASAWRPARSLKKKLFVSHMGIAALGVVSLLAALALTVWLRSGILRMTGQDTGEADQATETAGIQRSLEGLKATDLARNGIQRSLAGLRGWTVLRNTRFRDERGDAWDAAIRPGVIKLQQLDAQGDDDRVAQLAALIADLDEAQWWIEDIAQTPGNKALRVAFEQNVKPIENRIAQLVDALIASERLQGGGTDGLALLTDYRWAYATVVRELDELVRADTASDRAFRVARDAVVGPMNRLLDHGDALTEEQRGLLAELAEEHAAFMAQAQPLLAAREVGISDRAQHLMETEADPMARQAIVLLDAISRTFVDDMNKDAGRIRRISNGAIGLLTALVAVMVVVATYLAGTGANRITRPVLALSHATERLAAGELHEDIPVETDDELGRLTQTFNGMRGTLAALMASLQEQNMQIMVGVDALSTSTREVTGAMAQLNASSEETAQTVAAVKDTAASVSEKAGAVSERTGAADATARAGRSATAETLEKMKRIDEHMRGIQENITALADNARVIDAINSMLNDVATLSHVLAVNAEMEAVRAGDEGKGFAPVAKEMRRLADQSKKATAEVQAALKGIAKAIQSTMRGVDAGTVAVGEGLKQAEQAGSSIASLSENVTSTARAAAQIAASAQQQLAGMDETVVAIQNIEAASRQVVDSTRQNEATADNLAQLGDRLRKLMEKHSTGRSQS